MQKAKFDLEDFRTQMKRMRSMGSFESILKMIPGLGGIAKQLGEMKGHEKEIAKTEAIINSMTMKERRNPDIINPSRKVRIANGSGTKVQDVNQLLRQFDQMRKMMSGMLKGGKGKMPPYAQYEPVGRHEQTGRHGRFRRFRKYGRTWRFGFSARNAGLPRYFRHQEKT